MPAPDGARLAVVAAHAPRPCVSCGRVLEPPWWVTTFPFGEHERCRHWGGRPFPFARHDALLRKIARHLVAEQRRAVLLTATELTRLGHTWPREPLTTLATARAHLAAVRTHLTGAPHKLTAQL